ncbi:hypothetical protein, partial [Pseudomonas aeruginosa]|uniref:hypothetical protein n=1 Tax=Pseudomonas aeruginosa TaxID=287 RepID=UPI00396AAB92
IFMDELVFDLQAVDVLLSLVTGERVIDLLRQEIDQIGHLSELLCNLSVGGVLQAKHTDRVILRLVQKTVCSMQQRIVQVGYYSLLFLFDGEVRRRVHP